MEAIPLHLDMDLIWDQGRKLAKQSPYFRATSFSDGSEQSGLLSSNALPIRDRQAASQFKQMPVIVRESSQACLDLMARPRLTCTGFKNASSSVRNRLGCEGSALWRASCIAGEDRKATMVEWSKSSFRGSFHVVHE
jgi:hypothetical protein